VEAFIAGWGLDEALRRSEAYAEAGADAILMHSKRTDPSEIESFIQAWNNRHPVIIVPTKYYTTPTDTFRQWGVSCVIWANHNLRASVQAMQDTTRAIYEAESLEPVEPKVVPVKEIFRIQDEAELKAAEKKYL
jgi:phosphoenolpyruvate phosphomutase